jgi:drug/metabolite transporter (DMT)-like permease
MKSSSQPPTNLSRGYIIALISAIILSTTAIFIRYLTETYQIPPLVLAFLRDGFVVLTLLPILGLTRAQLLQVERHHLSFLFIFGFVLAIFNAIWVLSVALNGAAIATVLVYCSAGFTALLGWWFLKETLNWVKAVSIILSLGGCVLVAGALDPQAWRLNLLGILTGVISGLAYAVYTLMGRSASERGLNPWTTLLYTFAFATFFLLAINLLPVEKLPGKATIPGDFLWLGSALSGWIILYLLAAGPTLTGFGLYNVSLGYLPSSVVNLIVTLEPVFTAVFAFFLLGEHLNGVQISGSVMIMAGVVFLRVYGE